jgi:anti-anti-sigma regulatory factor
LRQFRAVLDRGHGLLVVDLASMTFINSSGLLVLEGASRYAMERNRLISFINPQPIARELSGLHGSGRVIVDGAASGSCRETPAAAG